MNVLVESSLLVRHRSSYNILYIYYYITPILYACMCLFFRIALLGVLFLLDAIALLDSVVIYLSSILYLFNFPLLCGQS